jgi:excisionase family DNA binding protein
MQSERGHPVRFTYSIKEVCEATSLGRTTVFAAISSGKLKARRIGGRTLIPAESLEAFLAGEG